MNCLVILIIVSVYWMLAAIFMRVFVPLEWHWLAFMLFVGLPSIRIKNAN